MLGMLSEKIFNGCDEGCDGGLHVGCAASVQHTIADGRLERRTEPAIRRPGRHHIGMPGKYDDGTCRAAPRPEIVHVAETHPFDVEAELSQPFNKDVLAACIIGGKRAARDQCFGKLQGFRHEQGRG